MGNCWHLLQCQYSSVNINFLKLFIKMIGIIYLFSQPMPKTRKLFANESLVKKYAPGHGKVERAKDNMWNKPILTTMGTEVQQLQREGKKYTAKSASTSLVIGRGGGGKKKLESSKKVATVFLPITPNQKAVEGGGGGGGGGGDQRPNPDADFFS